MAQTRICTREWDTQTSLGLWDTNRSPNLRQTTRLSDSQQKKKRTCQMINFNVMMDHRVNLKESEKRDICLDLAR